MNFYFMLNVGHVEVPQENTSQIAFYSEVLYILKVLICNRVVSSDTVALADTVINKMIFSL